MSIVDGIDANARKQVTASIDWCEENYRWTYFIAEWWNTVRANCSCCCCCYNSSLDGVLEVESAPTSLISSVQLPITCDVSLKFLLSRGFILFIYVKPASQGEEMIAA